MKNNSLYVSIVATTFIFFLPFSNIFADEPYNINMIKDILHPFMKFDPRVWKGNITISTKGTATEKKDSSRQGNVKIKKYSRNLEEKLVLNVCGVAGYPFYARETTFSYSDRIESHEKVKYAKTNCGYPPEAKGHNSLYIMKHYKPIIKRPGNSMHHNIIKKTYLCPENIIAVTEPPSVTLILLGEKYYLNAGFNVFLCTNEDDVQINIDVCSNTQKRVASHIEPTYPSTIAVLRKPGEENDRWISLPPIPHPIGMYEEGKISKNGNSITGNKKTPSEKSARYGYKEQTNYTWNLVAEDKCNAIYNHLIMILALAEAFSDSELRNKAKKLNEYRSKLVQLKACSLIPWCDVEKMKKKIENDNNNDPDDPDDPINQGDWDMAVNKDCRIENEKEFAQQQKEACEHPIIYDMEHKHEEEHVKQCDKSNKNSHMKFINSGITEIGQSETSAYLIEAEGFLGWLEESCKNRNLDFKTPEKRIDKIKARKAGWWESINN